MDFKTMNGAAQEVQRRTSGTFKRGKLMGRQEMRSEVIHDLDLILSLQTELEVRKELRKLLKHYKEQE